MALPATAVIEIRSTATAGNVNGGGFNSARGGTDYTLQDAAQLTATDYGAVGASTTLTSATGGFTAAMVGNYYHQTTTGTGAFGLVGWYEIVTYVDANTVTLDRTPNNGTASVGCTGYIGGAMSLGSTLDDDLFEIGVPGNVFYIKAGSYTTGETIAITAAGTGLLKIKIEGYNSTRGDKPLGATRPVINYGASSFGLGSFWEAACLSVIGSSTNGFNLETSCIVRNCKSVNTSTTAGRAAFTLAASSFLFASEGVCYRGAACAMINLSGSVAYGNYFHHSDIGIRSSATSAIQAARHNIIAANVTAAISYTAASANRNVISNNTLCGTPSKRGIGVSMATGSTNFTLLGNIIYGFVTGVSHADATFQDGLDDYNCYSNNTTDVTNWTKGANDIATAPAFTDFTERTGATATTTAGNHLVQSGATFVTWGITAGTDYVYISAGTGVTAGIYGILSVDSETQITVDITLTADATADKVWSITTGHNFLPTGAAEFSIVFPAGLTTSSPTAGAVQKAAGGGGGRPEIRGSNL